MSTRPLLETHLVDSRDDEIAKLGRENKQLAHDLAKAHEGLRWAQQELEKAHRSQAALKALLRPWQRAINGVMGELAEVEEEITAGNQPIPASAYAAWKERLPPACGRVIDALLVQPMNYQQLKNYCKMGASTLDQALAKLRANALIEKDGSLNRLKRA